MNNDRYQYKKRFTFITNKLKKTIRFSYQIFQTFALAKMEKSGPDTRS